MVRGCVVVLRSCVKALLVEESMQKKRQKKSIFIYGTTFGKWNLFRDFQRVQINSISHKNQKRITAGTQC
jgi:hypothetical protein